MPPARWSTPSSASRRTPTATACCPEPDRAPWPTRGPLHRPARRIQTHTRLRPPWHADPVQPGHGGAGRSDDLRPVPAGEGSGGARRRHLPGPAGHRTPAGKRGQHSGEYVRILPEHMLAIIGSGAHWWDTGSLGGSSSDRNPSGPRWTRGPQQQYSSGCAWRPHSRVWATDKPGANPTPN